MNRLRIFSGLLIMGADDRDSDARPQHDVTVRTFQISRTLTTFGQYKKCVAARACNAWEWVQDWYHDSYNGAPTDGSSWELVSPFQMKLHVTRGGDWSFLAHPAARRNNDLINNDPSYRWDNIGFRPARSFTRQVRTESFMGS